MYIHVNVTAGAREDKLERISETRFKVKVKAKAERNMANKAVIEIIARHFAVAEGAVRIINGHNSPSKLITIAISENTKI